MPRAHSSESDEAACGAVIQMRRKLNERSCDGGMRRTAFPRAIARVSKSLVAPLCLTSVVLLASAGLATQAGGAESVGGSHAAAVEPAIDTTGFSSNPETSQSGPATVTILWGQNDLWLTYQGVPQGAGQQGVTLNPIVNGVPGPSTTYTIQLPTSGTTCVLNPGTQVPIDTVSSCQIGIPLAQGEYFASVYVFGKNVQVLNQIASTNPANPSPLPAPPPAAQCGGPATTPITGLAASYASAGGSVNGYWKTGAAGGVSAFGSANQGLGSMAGCPLDQPIAGMVATPDGGGYWLVAKDGGIFTFGDAQFYGSTGSLRLNAPVVSMAPTPDNNGYWLVASDGGIFSFGNAQFHGSTGSIHLNKPIVGMAATPDGGGYWLVASDGGIFAFGDAGFYGSTGSIHLNQPVVGMVPTASGNGYLLVAADGGVFAYGDAQFNGSTGSNPPSTPVIGVVRDNNGGYWLVTSGYLTIPSQTISFGGAPNYG